MAGETQEPASLALKPAGRVPILDLDDGRVKTEPKAIMTHGARGSALVANAPFEGAKMLRWVFWEQYRHEPYTAVQRFQIAYLKREPAGPSTRA